MKFIIQNNEFLARNKIKNEIEQPLPKYKTDENPRSVEEIIIPPEKRENILNKLRQAL